MDGAFVRCIRHSPSEIWLMNKTAWYSSMRSRKMTRSFLKVCALCLLLFGRGPAQTVHFTVEANLDSAVKISQYIYGTNQLLSGAGDSENWTAYRLGGNRLTGFNWENNASNAGHDYYHSSDWYLSDLYGVPRDSAEVPGKLISTFQGEALRLGAFPLLTLQMAGFVSRDKNGPVADSETAPSPRWAVVKSLKEGPLSLSPDTTDDTVYVDECVNFLVNRFGRGNTSTGVRGYALDNEPSLWPSTHPRIHPAATTCQELTQKGIQLAAIVKNIDPSAEIFGPVLYGFNAFRCLQDAPDWTSVSAGKGYHWFIDYYLDEMKKASTSEGRRLLDVLDLHWYPDVLGDHGITSPDATTMNDFIARVQAPRTLWDPDYIENSWITKYYRSYLPLIPAVLKSINDYYPGTKLAFTEFSYGGENDISGAIAIDDVLGIFAKYGIYLATYWQLSSNAQYISEAYKMYRNYDGSNSTFGDYYVPSRTEDDSLTSVYASVKSWTDEIHIIAINKSYADAITGDFSVNCPKQIVSGHVWELDGGAAQINQLDSVTDISNNTFTYTLPAASICYIVLTTAGTPDGVVEQMPPEHFSLAAYPNPFNPTTTISYQLSAGTHVTLKVYDILGREVETLVNEVQTVGRHEVRFDGSQVAAGVYFYRLIAGNYSDTKKLLLMK